MTRAQAHAIDTLAARAFPILLRLFAVAGALTFTVAAARLMAALARFHI